MGYVKYGFYCVGGFLVSRLTGGTPESILVFAILLEVCLASDKK